MYSDYKSVAHRGPGYGFLVFWLLIAIKAFALFGHSAYKIRVFQCDFSLETEDFFADRTYVCNFELH